ncbi:MAG: ABC transporter permease [Alistipes sp.]|nr:ABC transporter permease [Alistipes sp.]
MFSPKSHSVINIIAWVSLIAVVVPTAAMVILMAVFDGLSQTVAKLDSAIDGDIEIVARRGSTFSSDEVDITEIANIEGVEAIAPYIEQSIMASSAGRRVTVVVRGVARDYFDVVALEGLVEAGRLESIFAGDVLLGTALCGQLGAYGIGTEIELYALNRKQISTLLPIGGISRLTTHLGGAINGNNEISSTLAIAEIERVQRLLNYTGRVSALAIRIGEGKDAKRVAQSIENVVGEEFRCVTREEKNASINAILRMEKYAIMLIGALIILVATFSIVGAVVMLITEKQRDIKTLRALGAKRSLIERIFVGEGMLLCVAGCALGILIGCGIALIQQHFGIVKIPGDTLLENYPVSLNIGDVATIVIIVIITGSVVSWATVRARLRSDI